MFTNFPFFPQQASEQARRAGERLFPKWSSRSAWLASVIRWLKPDIIHSQEIQHAGYLTLEARSKFGGRFPKWIVANWGSDICLYGRLPEHASAPEVGIQSADCRRGHGWRRWRRHGDGGVRRDK